MLLMSRKLVLGLHQVLCRTPVGLLSRSQLPAYIQTPNHQRYTVTALSEVLGSRPFAALACHIQIVQATSSATQISEADQLDDFEKPQDVPLEQYSHVGRITGPYVVKPKPVFAVVELGPTQFKVTPDDLVYSEKLKGVDVGDKVSLNRVLLLGNTATTVIGRPCVPGAIVSAIVEEQFLNGKVLIFKKRRRKNSRRLNGHRQELTGLRITEVVGLDAAGLSSV